MTRLRTLAAGAALTLTTTLLPGAASADSAWFRDARGDVASPNDIVRYKVLNDARIGVRTIHRNLRASAQDIQFVLDTNRRRARAMSGASTRPWTGASRRSGATPAPARTTATAPGCGSAARCATTGPS